MPKVLITGIQGFTGRYLAQRLEESGCEIHGLVRDSGGESAIGAASLHLCDLADASSVMRVVEQIQPDHVVHLAAIAFVAHGDIDEMYRTNILGTRHLLEALSRTAHRPHSVLIASSANIYGNANGGVIGEDTPSAPANDYGVTKVATEYVASLYQDRLPIIVTRPFNYTGVGQDRDFLIPKIIDHARRRESVLEIGNIDVARDFSDVRAVVDAYSRLLTSPAAIGQTLNVCSGEAMTLQEVISLVEHLSGHAFDIRVNPAFVRVNEVKKLCGSKARLEHIIGPTGMPPFEDTLRWMLGAQ